MNEIIRYNSTDKNIAAVKCYVRENLNGSPLYRDEDKTELIPKEEAIELFNKGLITVEYGNDENLMNAKPIFITDGEIGDINLDEEAGYGVIFFISSDHGDSSLTQLYVNIGDEGPTGGLYYDSELTSPVSFNNAVSYVENGNAIVYAYDDNHNMIFAAKPTCVLMNGAETYEVRFPIKG